LQDIEFYFTLVLQVHVGSCSSVKTAVMSSLVIFLVNLNFFPLIHLSCQLLICCLQYCWPT